MTIVAQVVATGVLLGLIYTLAGLGMSLSLGVLGVLNLTHGMAVLGGSIAAYELYHRWQLSPIVTAVVVMPVFGIVGWLLYKVIVQRAQAISPEAGLLALFGVMVMAQAATAQFWSGDIRSLVADYSNARVAIGGVAVPSDYVVTAASALLLLAVVYLGLRFSMPGRAVRALAQHPDAARILGVHVTRYSALVFALSMSLAAAAGSLLSTLFPFSVATQIIWLTYAFIVVLVGGTGGVLAALAGGLTLGIGQAAFNQLLPLTWVSVVVYGLLLAAMVARGGGLAAGKERAL
ncbi:MAG: branched-chain amino acid ABC transporter permease [Mycobacterium sp.]